jgi:hypothetical protein
MVVAMRSESHTKFNAWWSFKKLGYLENTGLLSGASLSASSDISPSFRARVNSSYIIFKESRYLCLLKREPPKAPPIPLPIFVRMWRGLATRTVPMAAPKMMINSAGCIRTFKFPCSIK